MGKGLIGVGGDLPQDVTGSPVTEEREESRRNSKDFFKEMFNKDGVSDDEEYYKKYGKYPTFESKLTHLFFCVCKFHCFADGNKRLAITLSAQFLLLNGYMAVAKTFFTVMENISYQVAAGRIDKDLLHRIIIAVMDGTYETDEELKIDIINAIS